MDIFAISTSFNFGNLIINLVLMKLTYGIVEFVVINVVIGYDVPLRLCKKRTIKIINKDTNKKELCKNYVNILFYSY